MKIYISGLYSGTNPQPGVGIVRSLRIAYPSAELIGVEYSIRCSGIHWHELDDVWLQRPWNELNLERHAKAIGDILNDGGLFISTNDLEILWLSSVFADGHPNLLTPPTAALDAVAKPAVPAHVGLPVNIPAFVTTRVSDWDLHAFCRQHNWKVWLKGPYYEAVQTRTWAELNSMRNLLSEAWSTETLFLQAHVAGYEESIALAAYQGELLHCVRMRKRDLTEINKTWAGDISEVHEDIVEPLRAIIKRINWTGGAELEMVRDADEKLWLLEWNPRFPAWIHGATLGGHNMIGILIAGATGIPFANAMEPAAQEFTRVVLEIPVKRTLPLSPLPEPIAGRTGHSLKHPSGLLGFAEKLHKQKSTSSNPGDNADCQYKGQQELPYMPRTFVNDISAINLDGVITPSFLFLKTTAAELFEKAADAACKASTDKIKVINAYSIKTNPHERMLRNALDAGFLAETISPPEVRKVMDMGFKPDQIILNGPGKWWRKDYLPKEALHAVFCDSIADLNRVVAAVNANELQAGIVGVRLRTPNIPSRFGIPVHTPEVFGALIDAVKLLPQECAFGIHFHMASSNVGIAQWMYLFEAMLRWCASIEAIGGRRIQCLDMGGGWAPDDWQRSLTDNRFELAVSRIAELLPHVREVISEPGKALAQSSMALAMRILEIQDSVHGVSEERGIVVDGSIAELPMHFVHPHRILHQSAEGGPWQTVGRGKTQLLGRLCMEHDVVATNVELPDSAKAGDMLVFCDAGAYDKSMSYVFGHG